METNLVDWFKNTPDGVEADAILRACVHCGFCTATCPTYQLLGDEKDGPRGRIYLMKQVMEGAKPTMTTMTHLDRCLTCRNCETTCPSGVRYGRLVDIGRKLVEERVQRPLAQRVVRTALREGLTRRWLFDPAMRVGKMVRPLLPQVLKNKIPVAHDPGPWPTDSHLAKVLLLNSCTQGAMMPGIDRATARVLDRLGVQAVIEPDSGCCGAIRYHLNDHDGGLADARRNIDAWWPYLEAGVEAIVMNASGCGSLVKEYGHLLRNDPAYAERAARVSASTADLIEWLPQRLAGLQAAAQARYGAALQPSQPALAGRRVAFHPPCTLQHGQGIRGDVERLLTAWGAEVLPVPDSHLCCGSAGTYSVLHPDLSHQLRDRKLDALQSNKPDVILSANMGCLTHLQSGTDAPMMHWIEWLDQAIGARPAANAAAAALPAAARPAAAHAAGA
ncbi:MAG: glycolate oxidase subunit GlcF [Lautropia sp.]|nr:glycolate oxidase subunit GlcF [Lautropia sp.]